MNLLIIGGTGVLSTAVVNEALTKDIAVTMVNRGNRPDRIPSGVELIKADVRDSEKLKSLLKERHFDAVIDFICYTKEQISNSIEAFGNVADQYIFISSSCVYDTSIPGSKSEDAPKGFKDWNYSTDKWDCEQYLADKAAELGILYTIVRPCITYDDTRIPYGIMPPYGYHWTLAARILSGKPVITWDGGTARWNMMRVEDFAVGIVGLTGNPKAYGEAFNICGDEAASWNEVLDTLGQILGKEVKIVDVSSKALKAYCPGREGEISARALDAVIDNNKIKQAVPEFRQIISLEDGIRKTVEAYKRQNYQKGIDWRFDAETDGIIRKWCKEKHIKMPGNLRFIDYLGNASLKDRAAYYFTLYKDSLFVRIINRIKSRK